MRKNTFSSKLFLILFANLFVCFYVEAITVAETLKDDVAAMITNAKKTPNQIFIIDSSDSMNSFAYSDYIDTCRDGKANLEKALALCKNAYQQCRNVESNAMCDVDLNCGDVSSKCAQIDSRREDMEYFCDQILTKNYKEPGRFDTVEVSDPKAQKYVGPWDPRRKYDEDLCFYDWTADTNADVLTHESEYDKDESKTYLGTSAADAYNKDKLEMTQAEFDDLRKGNHGYIAERSDWDCLTDGSDKMKVGTTTYTFSQNPVSGLWLNWKYATSLDALKIILADVHSFTVQPRYRGKNMCYRVDYKPTSEYKEERLDADGNPVTDEGGTPIIDTKKTCFIAFDTNFTDDPNREEEFNEMLTAIDASWSAEKGLPDSNESAHESGDEYVFKPEYCSAFNMPDDFSVYPDPEGDTYADHLEDADGNCGRCMKWNANPDGTGSFVETPCMSYSGSKVSPVSKDLANFTGDKAFKLTQTCCKSTQCSNPRCRDNDINCKIKQEPVDGHVIGYCSSWTETCDYLGGAAGCCDPEYKCILDHYSEFDQDANHCCSSLNCAEAGDKEDGEDGCEVCKSGSILGIATQTQVTQAVTLLDDPGVDIYCGDDAIEGCTGLSVSVGIDTSSISSSVFDNLEEIKVSVYYGCTGDSEDPSVLLGTGSCEALDDCSSIVSGTLDGCSDKGYRLMAQVTVTKNNCKFGDLDVSFILKADLDEGYYKKRSNAKKILNRGTVFYNMFAQQASSKKEKVYQYECKASFYNRETAVISGSSCPSASQAPDYLNEDRQGAKVEYCEARTLEREVIARDQWLNPTKVACSWLCRAAETYDDPWKCAAFFYMMDEIDRNGVDICPTECKSAMTNVVDIEKCCKCVNQEQGLFYHHQTPEGVDMSSNNHYVCAVSGYQYARASDGTTTTSSGYQAEIVNGHINEGTTPGYYNLVPYENFNDTSAYDPALSPYNGWFKDYSLINSDAGKEYLGSASTSLFTTNNDAVRIPTCVYDSLWNWAGEDCNSCGTGCCAIDLSRNSNDCDYPTFWMKIPRGKGGQYLAGPLNLTTDGDIKTYKAAIKGIKAFGGATLGETLYDVWRYLGGMSPVHDVNYLAEHDFYNSPFQGRTPECSSNEAIVISGGNPQFDHNEEVDGKNGIHCSEFSASEGDPDSPCVRPVVSNPTQHEPYEKLDWEHSSLLNVAAFVNSPQHSFHDKTGGTCAHASLSENAAGCDPGDLVGANVPIIDRVHAIAIGEWGLSAMYDGLKNPNADTGAFMDASFMEKVAKQTVAFDGTTGRYFGLTAAVKQDTVFEEGTSEGGTFKTLTELFSAFVNQSRDADVVAGRPHWTSSLVQPFDVEEKYRGPYAYVAGAVPIDGTISRFWFGNLKKYNVDGGTECPITDEEGTECGEWKKQTFGSNDCFKNSDFGSDFQGDSESVEQYTKLMAGGAAKLLAEKIEAVECSQTPCYSSTNRNIYFDTNVKGSMTKLKGISVSEGQKPFIYFQAANDEITTTDVEKIFDYMTGYDAFNDFPTLSGPTQPRYKNKKTFQVDDPFNVDFNHGTKVTIRPLYLGAIVHSKPVAVFYDDEYTTRIFAGANDGMLHAFAGNGEEIYAYMPTLAIPAISNFKNKKDNIFFSATVDGPITLLHIDQSHDGIINGGEKAYLIFGYRRGAKGYTVIDVSDKNEPKFVQNINTDGGYSFGKVAVFRKCSGTCSYANDLEYYIAVPGGYDVCHDPDSISETAGLVKCNNLSQLEGNKFTIYKLDKNNGKFDMVANFDPSNSSMSAERFSNFTKSWFLTSFTSVPFVVNTRGKAAVDTEFVYFTDLSGTVFRVDVRSTDSNDWSAKVVYSSRGSEDYSTISWTSIGRSYVGTNFFPPLERYNPTKTMPSTVGGSEEGVEWKIPIPVVTGNAANPRYTQVVDGMTIFYDNKNGDTDLSSTDLLNNQMGESHPTKNTVIDDKDGWDVVFDLSNGEKGITEPLIVYDIYGGSSDNTDSNSYSIAWNTYTPSPVTQCKTFGTSSNYQRYVLDGDQFFTDTSMTGSRGEWTVSADTEGKCKSGDKNISLATGVGIIASEDGYDLTFGAGADIFRKKQLTVKTNNTYIIKWYELY